MMIEKQQPVSQEKAHNPEEYTELVGRITVLRHGHTAYTETYPDLSERGKQTLNKAGIMLKEEIKDDEDLILVYSPAPRAKGSMAYLLHGMGRIPDLEEQTVDKVARPVGPLRAVKKINPTEAQAMIYKHLGSENPTPEQYAEFDRVYALSDEYETSPHWEPKSKSMGRANRLFKYAIKALVRNASEQNGGKTPRVVAVAHFETINHIATKIFHLDMEKDPLYARGESITFEILTKIGVEERVLLRCFFRGETRNAWFDITTGALTEV